MRLVLVEQIYRAFMIQQEVLTISRRRKQTCLQNEKRSYRVFEGLRVATLVSYIGALLMPILTIPRRTIANIQTGNLLYLVIHLVEGHIARAFSCDTYFSLF